MKNTLIESSFWLVIIGLINELVECVGKGNKRASNKKEYYISDKKNLLTIDEAEEFCRNGNDRVRASRLGVPDMTISRYNPKKWALKRHSYWIGYPQPDPQSLHVDKVTFYFRKANECCRIQKRTLECSLEMCKVRARAFCCNSASCMNLEGRNYYFSKEIRTPNHRYVCEGDDPFGYPDQGAAQFLLSNPIPNVFVDVIPLPPRKAPPTNFTTRYEEKVPPELPVSAIYIKYFSSYRLDYCRNEANGEWCTQYDKDEHDAPALCCRGGGCIGLSGLPKSQVNT